MLALKIGMVVGVGVDELGPAAQLVQLFVQVFYRLLLFQDSALSYHRIRLLLVFSYSYYLLYRVLKYDDLLVFDFFIIYKFIIFNKLYV